MTRHPGDISPTSYCDCVSTTSGVASDASFRRASTRATSVSRVRRQPDTVERQSECRRDRLDIVAFLLTRIDGIDDNRAARRERDPCLLFKHRIDSCAALAGVGVRR